MFERIADQLGDLELELSYSVEASADLGLLVPSLRVESASQVTPARSMFSHHYAGRYLTVAALIVLAVLLSAGLWVQQRRVARHHRVTGQQPRWTIAPEDFHA